MLDELGRHAGPDLAGRDGLVLGQDGAVGQHAVVAERGTGHHDRAAADHAAITDGHRREVQLTTLDDVPVDGGVAADDRVGADTDQEGVIDVLRSQVGILTKFYACEPVVGVRKNGRTDVDEEGLGGAVHHATSRPADGGARKQRDDLALCGHAGMDDHLDRAREQQQAEPPSDEGKGGGDAGEQVAHPFGRVRSKGVDFVKHPQGRDDRQRPEGGHHEDEQCGQYVLQGGEGLHAFL